MVFKEQKTNKGEKMAEIVKPKITFYRLPEEAFKQLLKKPPVRPLTPTVTGGRLPWIAGGLKIRRKIF